MISLMSEFSKGAGVLAELIVFQLVKKSGVQSSSRSWTFLALSTRSRHWSLFWSNLGAHHTLLYL